MKNILFTLFFLLFFANGVQAGSGFFQKLAQTNKLYEEGDYKKAATGYLQLLEENPSNGHLHYNLGNAFYQSNEYAKAIYHYLQSKKQLPRDEDVEANLSITLRKTEDIWDGRKNSPASAVLFWLNDFTLDEHIKGIIVLNFLFWVVAVFHFQRENESLGKVKQILAGILIITLLSTGARWHLENFVVNAVVSEKSLDVYSGEGDKDEVALQLHEGAVLPVLDRKGEWVELELPNGKNGWVPSSSVLI
ncbi:MAG: tetratricopeptide repeat protein [Candidatus Nitronauta litoralis]|uniref:Tetratricopeptide repeat protein n=1 Tax=Candidatus Nitronauta litoralis TaxID=2705533 RepID=A0A7T0BYA1_9BACT|nr:MAG: tetratricopeptide repeat protein [Candidatus Nitronauta litoralis]